MNIMPNMKNPLQTLNKLVKEKGITQKELGDALNQDQSLISKKLKGKAKWQPQDIIQLEGIFPGKIKREQLRPDVYGGVNA